MCVDNVWADGPHQSSKAAPGTRVAYGRVIRPVRVRVGEASHHGCGDHVCFYVGMAWLGRPREGGHIDLMTAVLKLARQQVDVNFETSSQRKKEFTQDEDP
jgi:hypothetical protein